MIGIAGLMVCAAIGVDYGWQPAADGSSLEYIIQIDPDSLPSLSEGEEIRSFIPPDAQRVTCFRVRVGSGDVPRQHTVLSPNNGAMHATPAANYEDAQAGKLPVLGRQHQQGWPTGPTGVNYDGPIGPASPYAQPQYNNNNNYNPAPSQFGRGSNPIGGYQPYQQQPQPGYNMYGNTNQNYHDPADDPLLYRYGGSSNFITGQTRGPEMMASVPGKSPINSQYRPTAGTPGMPGFGTTSRYATDGEKPWWPLLATTIALFISLGGNAYLGWVAAEFYTRYRDTVERMRAERRY